MAKGKRSGHRAEDVIASHAMKHHDFVGGAVAERVQAEREKDERVEREHEKLETEVVREMARELEQEAGMRPEASAAQQQPGKVEQEPGKMEQKAAKEKSKRSGNGFVSMGFELLESARDQAPRTFEALRHKAEERLAALPRPVKRALHRSEQAAALLFAPARIGVALAREILRVPASVLAALRGRSA